jgi:hypothetical protein
MTRRSGRSARAPPADAAAADAAATMAQTSAAARGDSRAICISLSLSLDTDWTDMRGKSSAKVSLGKCVTSMQRSRVVVGSAWLRALKFQRLIIVKT